MGCPPQAIPPCPPIIPRFVNSGKTGGFILSHHIWQKTLDQLRLQMTRATFDTWLQGTVVVSNVADHYQIAVKNEMAQEWLDKRLHETVQRTLKNFAGEAATVEFVVAAEPLLSLCPPCPPCPPQVAPFQHALPQDSSALAQVGPEGTFGQKVTVVDPIFGLLT
jgi:hypothetical protein